MADVQEDFSDSYPFLKIEFYDQPHHYKETSPENHRISPDKKIGAIRKIHNPGDLEILSWYKTSRIEREFSERFGLNVQVFRKENGTWRQSSRSDTYTLAEQMQRALQTNPPAKRKQAPVAYEYL